MCIIVSVDFMKLKMPLQRADADKMICWPAFQADILILSHIRWHHRGVAEECPPALSGTTPPPHHIFGNAGLADIDANLEKLAMDPRCSPQRINDAHLADKLAFPTELLACHPALSISSANIIGSRRDAI